MNKEINLIEHIEKNEEHPFVVRTLTGEITLEKNVKDFYEVSTKKDNQNRMGKTPTNLIQLINPFPPADLDISKLSYEDVRADYKKWNSLSQETLNMAGGILGFLSSGTGFLLGFLPLLTKFFPDFPFINLPYNVTIPSSIIGVTGIYSARKSLQFPKGTNNELDEYNKLVHKAKNADAFIQKDYRKYFIKKTLEKRIE